MPLTTQEWQHFGADLAKLSSVGLRIAERNSLNATAFDVMRESRAEVGRTMTLRNKFTERSISVNKATRQRDFAEIGSTQKYMADQELGGITKKTGSHGVAIPTAAASGETQLPRRRLVRKSNRIENIKLDKSRGRFKSKKQEVFVRTIQAVQKKKRYVFIEDSGSKRQGLYRVMGTGRKNARGRYPGIRMKMLYSIRKDQVTITPKKWLRHSVDKEIPNMKSHYQRALEFQLRRLKTYR